MAVVKGAAILPWNGLSPYKRARSETEGVLNPGSGTGRVVLPDNTKVESMKSSDTPLCHSLILLALNRGASLVTAAPVK